MDQKKIDSFIQEAGFSDYKCINTSDIVVAQWVRVKCTFGCSDYGLGACPPNTPSVQECRDFFNEYHYGFVIRLAKYADKDHYPSAWSREMTNKLLDLERRIFLEGYHKVFLLNQTCCCVCNDCSGNRLECKDKKKSRPSPEAFAVDVYTTVRNIGMELNVVSQNPAEMNRVALLLVE
jgi:predicted metal-binding protein